MDNFNLTDIQKRVRKAYCCIADLGDIVRKDYIYGRSCKKANMRKLQLLIAYLKSVCDYLPIDTGTQGSGTFALSGTNGTIKVRVNGAPISDAIAFNSSLATTAADLTTNINAYTTTPERYTATHTLGTSKVTLTAVNKTSQVNNNLITATTTGNMALDGSNATLIIVGGEDTIVDGDNCATEEQMQLVFEKISKLCEVCFKASGYSYS